MSPFHNSVGIMLFLENKPIVGREYVDLIEGYLLGLQSVVPNWAGAGILVDGVKEPLAQDISARETQVVRGLRKDIAYFNADTSDNSFRWNCRAGAFFSTILTFPCQPGTGEGSSRIEVGGRDADMDRVSCDFFAVEHGPDWLEPLFEFSVQYWKPACGALSRWEFDEVLDQSLDEAPVGWLTFLRTDNLRPDLPPGVASKQFDGGALLRSAEHLPRSDDNEQIRTLRLLRGTLRGDLVAALPG
jgi:hypothetical protein